MDKSMENRNHHKRRKVDTEIEEKNVDTKDTGPDIGTEFIASNPLVTCQDDHRAAELNVGISEVMCPSLDRIFGVVKQRYSDFLVTERCLSGELVNLSSTELPESEKKKSCDGSNLDLLYSDLGENVRQGLDETTFEKIKSLSATKDKSQQIILSSLLDKEGRKSIHTFIREKFSNLDSGTIENEDGEKKIKIFVKCFNSHSGIPDWPPDVPKYCHFCLYKENMDSMDAINLIARFMKVKPSLFSYAGTKDKRAVTVQQVSGFKIKAAKLKGLNKCLNNCMLGNFRYMHDAIQLGDLSGNHFRIVLRDVKASSDVVVKSMDSFERFGFLNYFGLQRFGTGGGGTHLIGKALLSSQWEEAFNLIMEPRSVGRDPQQEAKECWKSTKNPNLAIEKLTNKRCLEGQLLQTLCRLGKGNYLNSIQQIPRNTRLMYVHAFQSYIWNTIVSRRIKNFKEAILVGDLVMDHHCGEEKGSEHEMEEGNVISSSRVGRAKGTVKRVTAKDIDSNIYSIYDIVLPLPGYDVQYPDNVIKEWYAALLSEHGLDIDAMRHKVKDFSLSGAYRYIAVKPSHLKWSLVQYEDYTIPLFETDAGRLRGETWVAPASRGDRTALCLEFTLPPSSYATMALREISQAHISL